MFARRMKLIVASVAAGSVVVATLVAPVQAAWCCCAWHGANVSESASAPAPVQHASCCHQATLGEHEVMATLHDGAHAQPCSCSLRHAKNPARVTERIQPTSPDHATAWLAPIAAEPFSAPRDGRVSFGPTEARAAGPTLQSLLCVWRK